MDIYLNSLFKRGQILQLAGSVDTLLSLWMNSQCEKIVEYLLENSPDILYEKKIRIDEIIKNNPKLFNKILIDFWSKNRRWWISDTFFYIANQAYKLIDQTIINLVISQWLEFDLDYISMENTDNLQSKTYSKAKIVKKIYAFWDNAKYMLRDYLKSNNIFNF